MDRICKYIGNSHPRYNNGDIVEIQHGGDGNRKPHHSDEEWEALKVSRLDSLRQNAIGNGIAEKDIQVTWEKAGSHNADHESQIKAYDESLKTYAEKRKAEYPTIGELVVALYDTQDRAEIDKRRADVKKKYPKGVTR